MLTKAYVEEIVDEYRVKVRIPIFNGLSSSPNATPTEQLSISPICAIPGGKYNYSVGDIVFVTFEDNDLGRPVILGQLYADIDNQGLASLTLDSLVVKQSATLPSDTSIGNVSAESIKNLQGIRLPVQQQIDSLSGGVLGVGQNNPYMNTIVQNFMEAHYVVLPNGNYIVDSTTVGELDDLYASGDHYFYEFTKNIGTDTEETPIYNQQKKLYMVSLGDQWTKQGSWYADLDDSARVFPDDTPIYVVFTKDENNQVSKAILYAQTKETDEQSSEYQQMIFNSLEGTEVGVVVDDYSSTTNVHGNKKFWDLLLTNFVQKYEIVKPRDLPENPEYGKHYFTYGNSVESNDSKYDLSTQTSYPWTYKKSQSEKVIVFSRLSSVSDCYRRTTSPKALVYFTDGSTPLNTDITQGTHTYGGVTTKYYYLNLDDGETRTPSVIKFNDAFEVFMLSKNTSGISGDSAYLSPSVLKFMSIQNKSLGLQIPDISSGLVQNSFNAITDKYTISNVLQMVGVISMQLSGIDLTSVYGIVTSPRSAIDLSVLDSQYEGQYGTIPFAVDKLWGEVYGSPIDGVKSVRATLSEIQSVIEPGYTYDWVDAGFGFALVRSQNL